MKSKFILFASSLLLSATSFGQASVTTNGQRNSLIHESTGAWCGWCVDGAEICDRLVALDPRILAVSVHNGDGMTFTIGDAWNTGCVSGFPEGTVNCRYDAAYATHTTKPGADRGASWASAAGGGDVKKTNWWKMATDDYAKTPTFDITSMTQSYDQGTNTLTVTMNVKALSALTGQYNVNVIILESNITGTGSQYDQHNYYPGYASQYPNEPYISKPATITGFSHQRVLRAMLGGTWGTSLATSPAANATFTKTFTYTVTDPTKIPDMKVIGYMQKNSTDPNDREVQNAVQANMISWNPSLVKNTEKVSGIELFPNPAYGILSVNAALATPAETKVSMTNAIGQVVFSQVYPATTNAFGANISLDNIANGVYFVSVTSDGYTAAKRVVVAQ
jgi:hypothetical protein